MRSVRVVAVIAATLLTLPGVTACTGDDGPDAAPSPTPQPTPLADLATDQMAVARDSFCARVAPAAVDEALGAPAEDEADWSNGERAAVGGVTDVVHEFGCRWRAADGTAASGWVFAPPVAPDQAAALRRAAARAEGCREVAGAPAYGSTSVAVRCADGAGPVTTSFHGLFGDAWLSCSLESPGTDGDLVARAEQWCATVLAAATA